MKQKPSMLMRRNETTDDLPIAKRTSSLDASTSSRIKPRLVLVRIVVLCISSIVAISLFDLGLNFFSPPLSIHLKSKPSNDGRLLGHFPYPEVDSNQLLAVGPGLYLRPDAASSYLRMQTAAASEGVSLTILSAFRSISVQKQLFFDVKADRKQSSIDRAQVSAPPGFSEHSTGYAIDIGDLSQPQTNLKADFQKTKAYRWLLENASLFQFTLSFPKDNPQGVSFEPWHWRYEGNTDALKLFEPANRLLQRQRRLQAKVH